jgi:hypothetical protein
MGHAAGPGAHKIVHRLALREAVSKDDAYERIGPIGENKPTGILEPSS